MNTIDELLERDGVVVITKGLKGDSDYRFLGIAELAADFRTGLPANHAEAIGNAVLANLKGDKS